jgi:hypothetical protein
VRKAVQQWRSSCKLLLLLLLLLSMKLVEEVGIQNGRKGDANVNQKEQLQTQLGAV